FLLAPTVPVVRQRLCLRRLPDLCGCQVVRVTIWSGDLVCEVEAGCYTAAWRRLSLAPLAQPAAHHLRGRGDNQNRPEVRRPDIERYAHQNAARPQHRPPDTSG